MGKLQIYQLLPRLWRKTPDTWVFDGDFQTNKCGKLEDIDEASIQYIKNLGCNAIWLTGVIHHATSVDFSSIGLPASHPAVTKGKAGSPYAIIDYFTVSPLLTNHPEKRMAIFKETVHRIQKNGLKVIIDFVPNHVARQYHSTSVPNGAKALGTGDDVTKPFDVHNNFYYLPNTSFESPVGNAGYLEKPAKATGNDVFSPKPSIDDWYETVKLNYGIDLSGKKHFEPIPDTWFRMKEILAFWAEQGVDGFRCDMVEMVPAAFWKWVIPQISTSKKPIIFIGEAYDGNNFEGLFDAGFNYLYDKGNFYNQLEPLIKGGPQAMKIPQVLEATRKQETQLIRFWENHDEMRIASQKFTGSPWKGVGATALAWCTGKEATMLYFGQELGEKAEGAEGFGGDDGRTSIFDFAKVPTINSLLDARFELSKLPAATKELHDAYAQLGKFISESPAIQEGDFYDLSWAHEGYKDDCYLFLRHSAKEHLLFAISFNPESPRQFQVKIPSHTIQTLGLTLNTTLRANEALTLNGQAQSLTFYAEQQGISSTAPLQLQPLSVHIWKLVQ